MSAIARNQNGIVEEDALDPATRATEALLMGLRLAEGVDLSRIATKTAVDAEELLDKSAVERIIKLGFIRSDGDHITVTPQGMPLLDAILPEIVAVEALATA